VRKFGLALLLLVAPALRASDLTLIGATVYPSPDSEPIRNATIVIHGGRIASVGPPAASRTGEVLDCSGKFVVAGFWNSHVHLFTPGLLHVAQSSASDLDAQLDAMLNRWGFTTVWDIASILDNTLALRRRIASGEVRGPRIFTVGEPLWTAIPIYVRDYLAANRIDMPAVTTAVAAVEIVRAHAQRGADGIKLFSGSIQAGGKIANMPVDMMRAAVKEAHRHHLPVFAHPQNSAGLEASIEAGVDILAHTAPDSPRWTAEFVGRLRRARIALIPTLTLFDVEARKDGVSDREREQWLEKMVAELRAFSENGGEVLFGTDVGYIDHFDTALEFDLMHRAGLNYRRILTALTTNPARRFHADSHSGRIARGFDGDLVVLDADPAADVTNFSRVRYTIRAGQIIWKAE